MAIGPTIARTDTFGGRQPDRSVITMTGRLTDTGNGVGCRRMAGRGLTTSLGAGLRTITADGSGQMADGIGHHMVITETEGVGGGRP